nr:protein TAP1-like [Ipomoea batatas]
MQGLMLVMMQVEGQFAENGNSYTCWGGCYNQCVLLGRSSAVAGGGNFPCYIGCLSSCVPQSAAQYQNYCQIGCSLQLCFPSITRSTGSGTTSSARPCPWAYRTCSTTSDTVTCMRPFFDHRWQIDQKSHRWPRVGLLPFPGWLYRISRLHMQIWPG